jgi:hypothetical protein
MPGMGVRRVGPLDVYLDVAEDGAADVDPGMTLAAEGALDGEDFDDGDIDIEGAAVEGFVDGEALSDGDLDVDGAADEAPGPGLAANGAADEAPGTGLATNGELEGVDFDWNWDTFVMF